MATETYFQLWSKAFGLSSEELAGKDLSVVTTGYYVERHQDDYVFFYFDEDSGKRVLAGSEKNLKEIKKELGAGLAKLQFADIRSAPWFKDKNLAFKDIDYCLTSAAAFRPAAVQGFDVRALTNPQDPAIEDLYTDCSEDDKDTLDLTFDNEVALGIYLQGHLAGIARYTPVRDTQIADITVLVRNSARGQGLSTPLVSRLVEKIIAEGFVPKYRVEESLVASIAIAKKLGFTPRFRVLTWAVTEE